ncbi:MarR family EPS-associated transcriptional regulator [Algiphilus sp. W345]|uniref:MarR family EPS-associated transcriptional regulator n=1 Tax=Banduia mediterranea TaxID=3075609 RepID=A0ABU2WET2_9GAMM|nr:MarR family EPS-associated transcriptional regulator [Algiphilus sp. W345]MDT0496361.1 MarR family EPS-associated transcriptional regulator [Algiphilus sp. W345]
MAQMDAQEVRYRLLELIEQQPQLTQRQLAEELGVSVGKINYCLHALMEKGYVKLDNFRRNPNKRVYSYLLTPGGLEAKAQATLFFLQRKVAEYEKLRLEILRLSADVEAYRAAGENGAASSRAARRKR